MPLSQSDIDALQDLEESLWRDDSRFDRSLMDSTFAEDFYEIGRSGRIHSREDCLNVAAQPIDAVLPLPDFEARELIPGVAHVTYSSFVTYDGVVEKGRRSSIWSRDEGRWRIRFHQGTPFPDSTQ
ncbi:MAG: nuclear transport factor 2 family protein [bacterium]